MSDSSWNSLRKFFIPSDTLAGKQVIDELLLHLQEHSWIEHHIFGVHLAVEEAVVNAIKHGNSSDQDKKVHIAYMVSDTCFRIEITDEGEGFDPGDVPDPTDDEHLEVPSGRGVMLMRYYMSMVEFNDQGNCVTMEKHREDAS